ncbi:MAG: DUF2844 domain-containing protein [Terriglobales bacterium]
MAGMLLLATGLASQAIGADGPVLGQPIATAVAPRRPQPEVRAIAANGARVEEMRSSQGVVRAYVSASGQVFGLAWQSVAAPDLAHLLGAQYPGFQAAVRQQQLEQQQAQAQTQVRRGPLYVHAGNLVVEMSGHMRDHRGRAYLTDAIPAGLTPAVVQ